VQKHQLPELHNIKLQFQKAYPQIDVDKLLEGIFSAYSFFLLVTFFNPHFVIFPPCAAHPDIFNEMVQSRKKGAKQAQVNKPHLV